MTFLLRCTLALGPALNFLPRRKPSRQTEITFQTNHNLSLGHLHAILTERSPRKLRSSPSKQQMTIKTKHPSHLMGVEATGLAQARDIWLPEGNNSSSVGTSSWSKWAGSCCHFLVPGPTQDRGTRRLPTKTAGEFKSCTTPAPASRCEHALSA